MNSVFCDWRDIFTRDGNLLLPSVRPGGNLSLLYDPAVRIQSAHDSCGSTVHQLQSPSHGLVGTLSLVPEGLHEDILAHKFAEQKCTGEAGQSLRGS